MSATDHEFMREAIAQALLGRGKTHPNPSVGAVVVREGAVVGRGCHRGPGSPHAEVEAMRQAGEAVKGADLYVTLEPCCTFGRTPPCTRAIIAAGVGRVVAAVEDPNPRVRGKGMEELRQAGIEVAVGLLGGEGEAVDPAYHVFYRKGRPFVHLKWAQTLDGAVTRAGGGYLTGEPARERVHRDRFESDAILVSAGTVLADDPLLTVRLPGTTKPIVRVLLDSGMRLTGRELVFGTAPESGPVWVVRPLGDDSGTLSPREGVAVINLAARASGGFDLRGVLLALKRRDVMAVYVEAVGRLSAAFLREGLVDRLSIHLAPALAGGRKQPGAADGPLALPEGLKLQGARWERAGEDLIVTAEVESACLPD